MKNDRDYAAEIDALHRSIRSLRLITGFVALAFGALAVAGWTQKTGVVRATGLEIVDSQGQVRASIAVTKHDTIFKLAGGGPPNKKGIVPEAQWYLGINTNSLGMTDESGSVSISPSKISMNDSVPRITLERPLPFFAPPAETGAKIQVRNGQRVKTFTTD
jgi:hypothetical protein